MILLDPTSAIEFDRYLVPFDLRRVPTYRFDVVVMGSGVAGATAAITAARSGADVALVSKGPLSESNTRWAQGGMAAVLGEEEQRQVDGAARYLQGRWRALKHDVMMTEYMRTMYSQPDLDKARKHASSFLPKDRHGKLYPLSTPLKSFHSLGAGVALYMYMVHWWSLFFFAARQRPACSAPPGHRLPPLCPATPRGVRPRRARARTRW